MKSGLTHTVIHTAKCLKSGGEDDRTVHPPANPPILPSASHTSEIPILCLLQRSFCANSGSDNNFYIHPATIIERQVNKIATLEQKKQHYEEILRRELDGLDDEFETLRLLSQELSVRANGLRFRKAA